MPLCEVRAGLSRADIETVLADPWIAANLIHDGSAPEFIEHPLLTYHGAYVDGELAGLFVAIHTTIWEVDVHAAVMRPFLRYGRELGALFLDNVFADPAVLRATAYIISDLLKAANYARKLGFRDEGYRRRAVIRHGEILDIICLGLTRDDKGDGHLLHYGYHRFTV